MIYRATGPYTAELQWNRVSHLQPSDPSNQMTSPRLSHILRRTTGTVDHFSVFLSATQWSDADLSDNLFSKTLAVEISIAILASRFETTRVLFWDGPRNFELRSDVQKTIFSPWASICGEFTCVQTIKSLYPCKKRRMQKCISIDKQIT
ncbi:hypothetical protein AVEN_212268-1 [Araneus ventricosus]|uniref:Uncharacterized protein n=1 Tax=Araneus ventricosus TaxID=182803 RepID=A0A4Y2B6U9_ARAVE|nr:hypothetical protein AVEN_190926-1 [Araneus ventricosus]GBL87763.1 hypothetical protein AVEN_265656-1 [Araneus ventricosus]GBL87774.1 hypothetical protein AVEN_91033-1 [Araneus ventricosus]GBL87805.1 hypothetical protein AVEN_212268-1 [Araneus ventricosus]